MNQLRPQLEKIAQDFISGVLAAMSSGKLGELAGESTPHAGSASTKTPRRVVLSRGESVLVLKPQPRTKRGRRKRSSAADVELQKETALAAARGLKPGFSKGELMKRAGASVDLGRALSLLVAEGKLTKKGDRRLTRYSVK